MLGIFGRKSPGELAFQSAQRREKEYEGSGFDPTGLSVLQKQRVKLILLKMRLLLLT